MVQVLAKTIEVKDAAPETIERVRGGWKIKREELFARDGTDPRNLRGLTVVNGGVGQDFLNNEKLQNTVDKIVEDYIPLAARKLELREGKLKIENKGKSKELNNIEKEMIELDEKLVLLHSRSLKKIRKEGSGFEAESARHINEKPEDVAVRILGSSLKSISDGINSSAVSPLDGFFPRRFR